MADSGISYRCRLSCSDVKLTNSEGKLMVDCHAHTWRSYCADDRMTAALYAERIARSPELEAVCITDHSFAIYFPEDTAWSWSYLTSPELFDRYCEFGNQRLDAHLSEIAKFADAGIIPGLETEMMDDGRFTFDISFRPQIRLLIGSVHHLPPTEGMAQDETLSYWLSHTHRLLDSGIDVLGHPFRWLEDRVKADNKTIREIVLAAKVAGVALELNSHYLIETDSAMLRMAAEFGVPIAFATDSHRPDEIGDFKHHYQILRESGLSLDDLEILHPEPVCAGAGV